MNRSDLCCHAAVGIFLFSAALSGCNGAQPAVGIPKTQPAAVSAMLAPSATSVADETVFENGIPPSWRNLYVINNAGGRYYFGTVTVYRPGKTTPIRTISKDMGDPGSLAFDRNGNLYVGNDGWVSVYVRGKDALLRKIKIGSNNSVHSMTFDRDGYLYVASSVFPNRGGSVKIFAPNSARLVGEIRKGISAPWSIRTCRSGLIFVSNTYGYAHAHAWVNVYAPRTDKPVRVLKQGLPYIHSLACDTAGNLYVLRARWSYLLTTAIRSAVKLRKG